MKSHSVLDIPSNPPPGTKAGPVNPVRPVPLFMRPLLAAGLYVAGLAVSLIGPAAVASIVDDEGWRHGYFATAIGSRLRLAIVLIAIALSTAVTVYAAYRRVPFTRGLVVAFWLLIAVLNGWRVFAYEPLPLELHCGYGADTCCWFGESLSSDKPACFRLGAVIEPVKPAE